MYVTTVGDDYETGPFNVTIPTGEISILFSIPIVNDSIFEANESFILTIDSSTLPSRVIVQSNCMTVVTIVDDDGELFAPYDCVISSFFFC